VALEYRRSVATEAVSGGGQPSLTLAAAITDGSATIYEGDLVPGQSVPLPDGSTLTYVDLRAWSGVVLVRSPGLWAVYAGGAAALLALLLHFLVVPERIRVVGIDEAGPSSYRLDGRRWRYRDTYPERLRGFGKRLEMVLRDDPDSTAEER
jgi:hypothetical protein